VSKSATNDEYIAIAKTNEHVEVREKEILIANIDGKFYALNDRYGHINALLSMVKYVSHPSGPVQLMD
jgi:nitrite reductase/ring-hydroxylating ferredoxin subunit